MTGAELTIFGGQKLGAMVARKFGKKIIERWSRCRANKFFEGFVESLAEELKTGFESAETDLALDAILDDEIKSEVLFDAYRTVCFAKSKTLGPKIIGILTGRLVIDGRVADNIENQVFIAAETLSDGELIELFKEFKKYGKRADFGKDKIRDAHWEGNSIVIPWNKEVRDSVGHSAEAVINVSPVNFGEAFEGTWGVSAQRIGLISSRFTQCVETYSEDSERHIDQDGTLTIYETTVIFEPPCHELSNLIERALGASHGDVIAPSKVPAS